MARLRITLLLLALGIAVPAWLIVQRARVGLDMENAFRHEAVARRVFDEMERMLSDFLAREDARPVEDYATAAAGRFDDADEPFVIGWFVLDPSGTHRVVRARGDASRVSAAIAAAWSATGPIVGKTEDPAPGRTLRVEPSGESETAATDTIEEQATGSAYEVLSRLDRAQQLRSERKSRVRLAESERTAGPPPSREAPRSANRPEGRGARAALASGPLSDRDAAVAATDLAAALEQRPAAPAPADARQVDPLIGRAAGGGGPIALVRSVWHPDGAERQGVVLDRATLVDWLERRVLAETGLEELARVAFDTTPPLDANERRYVHRFAEPFDAVVAYLDLSPLPGLGGPGPIYALAGLLAVVAAVGLLAVQRGARTVVDYAKRRSDFVASVSHELKTPLTSIRMYGEMLRDGIVRSDAKREEYYATIADESERLTRLIDNVLEFSRLEQDRRPLQAATGPLDATVGQAAEKLRAHVEREGFALRLEIEGGLPAVRHDRDAVTQVVFNLVDNVLKYARSADRRDVVIGLRRCGAGEVEVCVRDYGPGVPPRALRRIFEPFYRGGDELTRTARGTGIGLALVRELCEAMGARVRASNAAEGGFEIAIAFPAQA